MLSNYIWVSSKSATAADCKSVSFGSRWVGTLMTFVEFKRVHLTGHTVKAGIIWPIGEEEYHARGHQFKSGMGRHIPH